MSDHVLKRALSGLRSMVARGKVQSSAYSAGGARTVLQAKVLSGEVVAGLELMLPYGMSALPGAGDVLIIAISGRGDQQLGVVVDDPALRIPDLAPGEFGFRDARGQQVVFRTDRLEVTTPLDLVANIGGSATITAAGDATVTAGATATLSAKDVVVHASHSYSEDVNGYGSRITFVGGNAFQQDTYTTGAVVTATELGWTPPALPDP